VAARPKRRKKGVWKKKLSTVGTCTHCPVRTVCEEMGDPIIGEKRPQKCREGEEKQVKVNMREKMKKKSKREK